MAHENLPGLRSSSFALFLAAVASFCPACGQDDSSNGDQSTRAEDDAGAAGGSGGEASSGGQAGEASASEVEPHPECDLTGTWISVRRTLSSAVGIEGVQQSTHNWQYWEFEQDGVEAVVVKGLRCGFQLVSRSTTFATDVTVGQAIWDAMTTRTNNDGRRATYGATAGDECFLNIERRYVVRGVTADHFMDPSVDLEQARTQATETTPGWEDWDGDGHPGVTFKVSGLASGALYVAQRDWYEYEGTTPRGADKFEVVVTWNTEQVTLGRDPEQMPSAESVSSIEPEENFIWFARVDGLEQWDVTEDADDLAICARVRELKDQLLPEGNR